MNLDQHRPRAFDPGEHSRATGRGAAVRVATLAQKQAAGVGHGGQSVAGHLVNADFVGRAEAVLDRAQNPERMAALALEVQDGVDHVLDHFGAGDRAFLGDVADEDNRRPPALGQPDQLLRRAAHLRHRARGGFERVQIHGLDGIDDQQIRRSRSVKGGQDIANGGPGSQLDRRIGGFQPFSAQPHLIDRFLAADVGHRHRRAPVAVATARKLGRGLQQQGRLADPRVTANQQRRAGDQPAARHPVQFGISGRKPGRGFRRARKFDEVQRQSVAATPAAAAAAAAAKATATALLAQTTRRAGVDRFFDQRVPASALLALARPARVGRAAVLADVVGAGAGHQSRPRRKACSGSKPLSSS